MEWLVRDVVYRIAAGLMAGVAAGWLLGRVLFVVPRGNVLADTSSGVVEVSSRGYGESWIGRTWGSPWRKQRG